MPSLSKDAQRLLPAAFLIAALTGCGPGIDPITQADVERRASLVRQSPLQVAAPTSSEPRPFAVGQWTQHKIVDFDGRPRFLTTKIVGREGDAFWFESVLESEHGRLLTKLLVFVGDRRNRNSIKILAGKVRFRTGTVVESSPSDLARELALFDVVVSWEGQSQEDTVVPAGAFRYCFKGRNVWQGWLVGPSALAWSHPAVPISGLVRAEPIPDPQPWYRGQAEPVIVSTELVGFGDTGATSELP